MRGFYPTPSVTSRASTSRIDFRAGAYVLVDTSSNGTYVNGAQVPLGKYHDYVLKDGDYIRLGEYELLVTIDKSNDFPPDPGAIVAYDGQAPSAAVKKSTANDLGADLDLSQLLEPSDQLAVESGVRPRDAYGQAVTPPRPARAAPAPAQEASATPWHMMTRPLKVEDIRRRLGACAASTKSALYEGDYDLGLATFCRGAGVDPRTITPKRAPGRCSSPANCCAKPCSDSWT